MRGQRADDIVRLVVRGADHRHPERAEHLTDDRDLRNEQVRNVLDRVADGIRRLRSGDPVGLVGGNQVHPPTGAPVVVPAGNDFGRPELRGEPGDDVEQPPDGVHGRAVRRLHGIGHPVEGTEVQGGGVEEHQALAVIGHGGILPHRQSECDRPRQMVNNREIGPSAPCSSSAFPSPRPVQESVRRSTRSVGSCWRDHPIAD